MTALAITPDRGTGYERAVTTGVDSAIRVSTAIAVLVPHQATFARLTIRRRRGSLVWRFRQAM